MTVDVSLDSVIQDNGMALVGTDAEGMPQLQEEEQFQATFADTSLVAGGNDLGPGTVHTSTRCAHIGSVFPPSASTRSSNATWYQSPHEYTANSWQYTVLGGCVVCMMVPFMPTRNGGK